MDTYEKAHDSHVEAADPDDGMHKQTTTSGDIGLKLFNDYQALARDIDPQAERRLVRKIDCYVIPFICVTYLITYIDKATLSYGRMP
jgi:hypothetical protein